MTKKDKLTKLDGLVLDKMITIMEKEGDTDLGLLTDLTPAVNYLRNNQEISEKSKGTVEEATKKRLKAASDRRKKNESK